MRPESVPTSFSRRPRRCPMIRLSSIPANTPMRSSMLVVLKLMSFAPHPVAHVADPPSLRVESPEGYPDFGLRSRSYADSRKQRAFPELFVQRAEHQSNKFACQF